MKTYIPENYKTVLGVYDTQKAIGTLHSIFEDDLSAHLHLRRVSAPLFVEASTGLNDDLNGVERPVSFDVPFAGKSAQVVHSLAKWKRMALKNYNFYPGNGIYTDMNAIRRDEELDNLHSVYVDQWDWEKVITREDRNATYLKDTVRSIVGAICETHRTLKSMFPALTRELDDSVAFVTSQELEDMWPDGRAPDYDDWKLNGDILFWNDTLGHALEISSMGIRVDAESLDRQLTEAGCDERRKFPFHKMLLNNELPLTIGGGIGQSRLSMLLLEKAHIGEVQVSVWDDFTIGECTKKGVMLL